MAEQDRPPVPAARPDQKQKLAGALRPGLQWARVL
jgi:hypothetical protein